MAQDNPCSRQRGGERLGESATRAIAPLKDDCCCCGGSVAISVAAPLVMSRTAAGTHLGANVPACMALVELTGAMARGATGGVDDDALSGTARVVTYQRAGNAYSASTEQADVTVYYSLGRHAGGVPVGPPPLTLGDRGWVFFNAQSGRWELVERDRGPWRFKLTGTLTPGGSATAELVAWNGSAWVPTGETITIYDSLDMFGGVAGARGLVFWCADSARWEIAQIDSCECASAELTCITVLTGVAMVDENLVFTRKQVCLPAMVTISELANLVIEGCCAGDGEPTEG